SPSLSISEGHDGCALVTCHAGCSLDAIVSAAGLTKSDLFAPRLPNGNGTLTVTPPQPTRDRPALATSYDYTDASGALLFQVCRMIPKDFRQRRSDGAGNWIWNLGGLKPVLYRLPDLIEAVALGKIVHIPEGEKDVDRLVSLGLTATTNPMGAGKWRAEYAEPLTGADVVILPDNDEPGRRHAEHISLSLAGIARSVRILQLPNLPAKGDVSDWLDQGHTRSELEALAATAPTTLATDEDAPTSLAPAVCALTAPTPVPIQWAIEDVWTAGDLGLFVGDGGAFKSSAALHIAGAVAGGYDVFDRFPVVRRPVLIVSAEDPQSVILMRLNAFIAGHGWDRERVLGNVHLFADCEPSLARREWQAHILKEAARLDAGMIVLDPWAELIEGDESSNTDMRPIIKFARRLAKQTTAAVGIVHHAGKAAPEKRTLDRIRGATALTSAARVILFFEFRDDGVYVENLKLSRAERLKPFTIQRQIEHQPGNRAQWRSARLTYEDAKQFERTRADDFVLMQLRLAAPARRGSRELRALARDVPGIRNEELDQSLHRLQARGMIDWQPGPRSGKLWGLADRAHFDLGTVGTVDNGRLNDRAHRAPSVPGHSEEASPDCAGPFRGPGTVASLPADMANGT
ncbi:MAG TPA: AAA family ATPase, partial [Gemmatimonadaceae bacterium]